MAFSVSKPASMWLLILTIVLIVLSVIQIVRVNRPKTIDDPIEKRIYTAPGPLLANQIEVPASGFFSHKIDLNRRMKLNGTFRTANLKSTVAVLILREVDLDMWKSGAGVSPIVKTNSVPGGRITPVLEPGIYYLVIDNRSVDQVQLVTTDFVME